MWIGLSDETIEEMNEITKEMDMRRYKPPNVPLAGQTLERTKNKPWQCLRCGKCCTFIIIPVRDKIDMETKGYLDAHGIKCLDKKLIIPARCRFLRKNGKRYKCKIHDSKFANCRLGGEKECKEAQKAWSLLNQKS